MSGIDLTNLISNNGISELSELTIGKIILKGTDDATDFNSGDLQCEGGLSVQKQTRLLDDVTLGEDLFMNNNKNINFQDNAGSNTVMLVQSDNNFVHYGSDATGNLLPAWGIPMRNSNSAFFTVYPIISLNGAASTSSITGSINSFGGISSREPTDAVALGNGGSLTLAGGASISKKCFIGGTLQVEGTSSTVRFPNLTTTQRDALVSPGAGAVIYNTTTSVLNFYNGSVWAAI